MRGPDRWQPPSEVIRPNNERQSRSAWHPDNVDGLRNKAAHFECPDGYGPFGRSGHGCDDWRNRTSPRRDVVTRFDPTDEDPRVPSRCDSIPEEPFGVLWPKRSGLVHRVHHKERFPDPSRNPLLTSLVQLFPFAVQDRFEIRLNAVLVPTEPTLVTPLAYDFCDHFETADGFPSGAHRLSINE